MKLTQENKDYIDNLTFESLLSRWRFAPAGDPWFADETGEYWSKRMMTKRSEENDNGVGAGKRIGWGEK